MSDRCQPVVMPKPTWTKPELVRLGTIKQVAGPSGIGTQSGFQNRS